MPGNDALAFTTAVNTLAAVMARCLDDSELALAAARASSLSSRHRAMTAARVFTAVVKARASFPGMALPSPLVYASALAAVSRKKAPSAWQRASLSVLLFRHRRRRGGLVGVEVIGVDVDVLSLQLGVEDGLAGVKPGIA